MRRRNYVVTYDISDDRRRAKVFRLLHGFGDHAQYSVFFCQLNDSEVVRLRLALREEIHHGEDQVLIVEVGRAVRPLETALDVVGEPMSRSCGRSSCECERRCGDAFGAVVRVD